MLIVNCDLCFLFFVFFSVTTTLATGSGHARKCNDTEKAYCVNGGDCYFIHGIDRLSCKWVPAPAPLFPASLNILSFPYPAVYFPPQLAPLSSFSGSSNTSH